MPGELHETTRRRCQRILHVPKTLFDFEVVAVAHVNTRGHARTLWHSTRIYAAARADGIDAMRAAGVADTRK